MEPRISDVIKQAIRKELDGVHVALPGTFTAYDYLTKRASVQPDIIKVLANGLPLDRPYPKGAQLQLPIITDVPVIWTGTSKGGIHTEITLGVDTCLLVFSERSLENWLSTQGNVPALPGDYRQFSLSDAIAIPGLFTFTNPGKVGTGKGMELLWGNGAITIDDAGLIKLGNNITDLYTVLTNITTLLTNIFNPVNVIGDLGVPVQILTNPEDFTTAQKLIEQIDNLLQPTSEEE